jgi:prepilin-type N-terminal cleavage/methylation domain-containing protein/prepilin-type processing-associated H-X9-DG protein
MKKNGFTLVELIVVVGIILLLIMLLLPAVGDAREAGRKAVCRSRLRAIGVASLVFAQDHDGMPPSAGHSELLRNGGADPQDQSFIGKEVLFEGDVGDPAWPLGRYGSILTYMGGVSNQTPFMARSLYRCPSLRRGVLYSGIGSNGFFDYCMVCVWNGVPLSRRPNVAYFDRGFGRENFLAPWVVDEDPSLHCNGTSIDPGHGYGDRIGRWHGKGQGEANVLAVDGSVHPLFAKKGIQPTAAQWRAIAPSGNPVTLYGQAPCYGLFLKY